VFQIRQSHGFMAGRQQTIINDATCAILISYELAVKLRTHTQVRQAGLCCLALMIKAPLKVVDHEIKAIMMGFNRVPV